MEDWLCRRGQGGQGRKEAGCSLRSGDETDRGKGLYGGASPVSREGNLDVRHCVLGEGMQSCGEKSGVIWANAPATEPVGATVPCIRITVGSHITTQVLIRSLGGSFCMFGLVGRQNIGLYRQKCSIRWEEMKEWRHLAG